jgi:hypothetical protein
MNNLIVLVPTAISLFLAGANVMIFCVVKFNDIKHIQQDIKDMKKLLEDSAKREITNGERIANIEGKCKANHG